MAIWHSTESLDANYHEDLLEVSIMIYVSALASMCLPRSVGGYLLAVKAVDLSPPE